MQYVTGSFFKQIYYYISLLICPFFSFFSLSFTFTWKLTFILFHKITGIFWYLREFLPSDWLPQWEKKNERSIFDTFLLLMKPVRWYYDRMRSLWSVQTLSFKVSFVMSITCTSSHRWLGTTQLSLFLFSILLLMLLLVFVISGTWRITGGEKSI